MPRRYGLLLAIAVALGLALAWAARAPRRAAEPPVAPVAAPRLEISLEIGDGAVSPAAISVPKGSRVALSVVNRGRGAASLELAGYQDRLRVGRLAAGSSWRGEFLADRPGEDFAWLVDGKPAGRLSVTGSHLVEGHR